MRPKIKTTNVATMMGDCCVRPTKLQAKVPCDSATFPREREVADDHEMRAQMSSDDGDQESAADHMKCAHAIRRLIKLLDDANSLLRSAHEVAKRDGAGTNWQPFRDRLMESLKRQHKVMYPSNKLVE